MKILYLTNIPSPYYVDFFNELGKKSELTVLFELKHAKDRNQSWKSYNLINFNGIFLKSIRTRVDAGLSISVVKYLLFKKWDRIVINNFSTPTGVLSILILKFFRINYVLESFGGFPKTGKGLKEKFKKFIISHSSQYLSAAKITDEYFKLYGANANRIYRYKFSSLYKNEILGKVTSFAEKKDLKLKLGLRDRRIALYVGQFISIKNIYWLIKEWNTFNNSFDLVLIGEGIEKQKYIKFIEENKIQNVFILDFMSKHTLKEYYQAADLYVHPTLGDDWGLVINEALSNGIPAITTPYCIAGDELVIQGFNGYITLPNIDFIDTIQNLSNNHNILNGLSINALKSVKDYHIENMAKDIFSAIK